MARVDYEEVATSYDQARALELDELDGWRDAVAPFVEEAPDSLVLDVGAGTGVFAYAFAEWFRAHVVAVEPSAAMRAKAISTRPHPRIEYVEGDAARLPVAAGSAGLAWLSTVLHHIPDLSACASALRAALRPRGPVLIRSAFPGHVDSITLFRFFPEGARIVDTFPTVESTVAAFGRAGFGFVSLTSVPQVSAPNLAAFLERARLRADTVLRGLSDDEFARGIERLEHAVAETTPGPVIDRLNLLVLR